MKTPLLGEPFLISAITAADPAERESYVDPMADKIFRHPTFYELPDEVKHM